MKIGILAVQGDFDAHAQMLAAMGVESVEVRTPADLADCDGADLARRREHHPIAISKGRRLGRRHPQVRRRR